MSTDRHVASLLRSWLRSDENESADHILAAVLVRIDTIPQRRATWWPARRPEMNTIVKFGIAAAVLAMAVALGYGALQNIGTSVPEPPEASDDASPAPAGLPSELNYVFIGPTRDVPGLEVDDRLVMDLTMRVFRLHTGISEVALVSTASVTEAGQLRLETVADGTGCDRGDTGSHAYSLSEGGTILTIEPGDDDCAARGAAVAGEWRRSACPRTDNWCLGPLEAGAQTSLFFDPYRESFNPPTTRYGAISYEVPGGWTNADDRTHFYSLLTGEGVEEYDGGCIECPDSIWIGATPRATVPDCSETIDETVGTAAAELAAWLASHPALDVTEQPPMVIDGREVIVLDIEVGDPERACDVEGQRLVDFIGHPGYTWGISSTDRQRLLLLDLDDQFTVAINVDPRDASGRERLATEAMPILESLRFSAP